MTSSRALVDAIATDLDTVGAGLPTHSTIKHRRPRAIMPADCPLMCVWLLTKDWNYDAESGATTDRYDGTISIGISWHEESVEEAQTLVNDPDLATALVDNLEKIEARSRAMSQAGLGVAGAYELLPGSSVYAPPEMQDALVEGVVHEIVVRVSEV